MGWWFSNLLQNNKWNLFFWKNEECSFQLIQCVPFLKCLLYICFSKARLQVYSLLVAFFRNFPLAKLPLWGMGLPYIGPPAHVCTPSSNMGFSPYHFCAQRGYNFYSASCPCFTAKPRIFFLCLAAAWMESTAGPWVLPLFIWFLLWNQMPGILVCVV